jgi:putative transposase
MKSWLSAAEIAALKLPGLPTTERGVQLLAQRRDWTGRGRDGRGGGVEYPLDALPAEARLAYVVRHVAAIDVPAPIARDAACEPDAAALNARAIESRDARLAILGLADRVAAQATIGRTRADRHFCDLYNGAQLTIADWIKAQVRTVTPRTLERWRALQRKGRSSRLAVDRAASRKGSGVLDRANGGEVRTYILALLAKQPQLTAHHLRTLLADRYPNGLTLGEAAVALPPIRTFQHALKGWRKTYRNELTSLRDPDRFKSTVRFAAKVARPAERLNQLWQIDASPADVLTTEGRLSLYVCEDIYSRRLVALVTRTPRSAAVGLTLRKAMLDWGVPEAVKTDNGSDFVSHETYRLFAALGIEHLTARPFAPEQKGHVERAIGTLQRGLMRTLPGFVGHSVADRKQIEGRKAFAQRLGETPDDAFAVELSPTDLQARVDDWCADVYGNAPHAGLQGLSPSQVAASAAGAIRTVDLRALDVLLAPVAGKDGIRTATKLGIRIGGAHYIAGFLEVGAEVLVRMDPADEGRAYVFERDGLTFLGEALCPDLAGIDPAAAITAVRAEQKRRIDEALAAVRPAARRIRAIDIAPAIHRQALKDAGTLVEFPNCTEAHETPALAAARTATERNIEPVYSAEIAALQQQLLAKAAAPNVKPLRAQETEHQRWHRARAIEDALARGEQPSADELIWLGGYREGPEYRGFALTYGVPLRAEKERPASEAGR